MIAGNKKIENLFQNVDVLGTGFIPVKHSEWWFAVGNKKYWKKQKNQLMISFTAIGGHVEEGESFKEATLREIQEETGTTAIIQNSHETLFVTAEVQEAPVFDFQIKTIELVNIVDEPRPYLLYLAQRKTDTLGVVVYKGYFQSDPIPQMEVPALLYLPPDVLIKTPMKLTNLLSSGAKIKEQLDEIPREAIIYPFGSATIIQSILKKEKKNSS